MVRCCILGALTLAFACHEAEVARGVIETVSTNGERHLHQPMRAPSAGPRVLVVALDGVGAGELHEALPSMPNLTRLLGAGGADGVYAHAYSASGVLTILPSTTVAAWAAVFTGAPPAHNGVPGNEWFARHEDRYYAPAPVSVSGLEDVVATYVDNMVGRALKVPALYERAGVRSYVSMSQIYADADVFTGPEPQAWLDLMVSFLAGVAEGDPDADAETYRIFDDEATDRVLESIEKHGLARLQVVYFPGIDLFTHVASNAIEAEKRYLVDTIDDQIGRLLGAYSIRGALDDTYVIFVADHGHTPVLHDERHALAADEEKGVPEVLRAQGFRVREAEVSTSERDYQAVLASQGAIAYVYLADRTSCPERGQRCDWRRPPRFEEDVLPVARALHRAGRDGEGAASLRGTLDLVLVRRGSAGPFEVLDGARVVPLSRYLASHPRPDLLRFAERLEALAVGPHGDRAGDVLLVARSGLERPIGERFYFSKQYRSWHGSPCAQDSEVPLIVAHAGRSGVALRAEVERVLGEERSVLGVTPLVLELLR